MGQLSFYASDIVIIAAVNLLAAWGLDLQYGIAGINSFAFIVFQSAGAYSAAIVTIGRPSNLLGEQYIGGAQLPFPLPLLVGAAVGCAMAVVMGLLVLPRLRGDYEAIVFLVLALIASGLATAAVFLVNGSVGLAGIPEPLSAFLNLSPTSYQLVYAVWGIVLAAGAYWLMARVRAAPFGRRLRAVRDNEPGAASIGLNVRRLRLQAFVIGGGFGGLSGALLVDYVGAWGPASWGYSETFALFAAIIVGGTANMAGVTLGTLLLPVGVLEATRFLPQIGYPGLVDSLDWVVLGSVMLLFLWLRPQGILPERRHLGEAERATGVADDDRSPLSDGQVDLNPVRQMDGEPN